MFNKRRKTNHTEGPEVVQENTQGSTPKAKKIKLPGFGKFKKIGLGVVLGLFAVVTFFQTTYTIEEDEYAVLRTFGSVEVIETLMVV